jgi:hypothetical protein
VYTRMLEQLNLILTVLCTPGCWNK